MIRVIKISDLCKQVRLINKIGRDFGFTVYLLIDEKYLTCHRNDGELIFKAYHENMEKMERELIILKNNLIDALFTTSIPRLKPRKNKHIIYFNF